MAGVRFPVGLAVALVIVSICVAAVGGFWALAWPVDRGLPLLAHVTGALCLGWALVTYLLHRDEPAFAARPVGRDFVDVMGIMTLFMGLITLIIMIYAAVTETLLRTVYFHYQVKPEVNIWPSGFVDLIAVALAILLSWLHSRQAHLVTALFWVLFTGGLWACLQTPAYQELRIGAVRHVEGTPWARWLLVVGAVLVVGFTVAAGLIDRRRRLRAWPDNLARLADPPVHWPGFRYSAGVIAAIVLMLGCVFVAWRGTTWCAAATGAAMLVLASRRWNESLVDAGLALVTLAVVSIVARTTPQQPLWSPAVYADLFTRVVIALAVMVWFWHWLAGVWKQQLDEGRAWTTAGRMIRTTERVGYLVGAIAVLIALHVALWPMYPHVYDTDASTGRWVWGLSSSGLLVLALGSAARRTGKATLGWLTLFAVATMAAFALARSNVSGFGARFAVHWPLASAVLAAVTLIVAAGVRRRPSLRPFWECTYLTGILILPVAAIAGVSLIEQLRLPIWMPGATFLALGGVYLLAAVLPGPRAFAAVGVLCAATGLWHLRQASASPAMPAVAFYGLLIGVTASLLALIWRPGGGSRRAQIVKWAGGALALVSVLAGWVWPRG